MRQSKNIKTSPYFRRLFKGVATKERSRGRDDHEKFEGACMEVKFMHKDIFCLKYTIYQYLNHNMASPPFTLIPGCYLGTKPRHEWSCLVYTERPTPVRDQNRASRLEWRYYGRANCDWVHEAGQRKHEIRDFLSSVKCWWSLVAGRGNLQSCPRSISRLSRACRWRNDMGMYEFEFGWNELR